jgi:hypothetical protein
MKNVKNFVMATIGCLALSPVVISCSDDDDNNNNTDNSQLVGTYRMTAFNAPMAIDFNNDGTSSVNLMDESNCYNDSFLVVNQNGTYTMTSNTVNIDGTTSSCASEVKTGSWTRSGNTFTTSSGTGANVQRTDFSWNGTNRTFTRNATNFNYPTWNTVTNSPEWGTGNVSMIYTRQ